MFASDPEKTATRSAHFIAAATCSILLAGCVSRGSIVPPIEQHGVVSPLVVQQQGGTPYVEFSLNSGPAHQPFSLTASVNDTVWFCDRNDFVGRMDMAGHETDYPIPQGRDYLNFTKNIANNPYGDVYVSNGKD